MPTHQTHLIIKFATIVVAGTWLMAACSASPTTPAPGSSTNTIERAIGPSDAPVTIVEYGDLGCPTCRGWYNAHVLDQILNKYSKQVRFIWRDFPVITPLSPKAAEAGWCAQDQGKFWEFHDLVYDKFQIDAASLKADAAQLGLDMTRFNQCLDSGLHTVDVNRQWEDAKAHGFRATPSFLINDQPVAGPIPFDQLVSLIDPILAAKK
ncbi:MAG TPA: thioredoxin domain-containing protein [Anaerolineae bacterium]|nr:thioredoxin domain-containing protein [Anaerolineae bacterium]